MTPFRTISNISTDSRLPSASEIVFPTSLLPSSTRSSERNCGAPLPLSSQTGALCDGILPDEVEVEKQQRYDHYRDPNGANSNIPSGPYP